MGRTSYHFSVEVWGRRITIMQGVRAWRRFARRLGRPWPFVRERLMKSGSAPIPLCVDGEDVTLDFQLCGGATGYGLRLWFVCPGCVQRRGVLYAYVNQKGQRRAACRTCLGLRYILSQSPGTYLASCARGIKATNRIQRLLEQLKHTRQGSKRQERVMAALREAGRTSDAALEAQTRAMKRHYAPLVRLADKLAPRATCGGADAPEPRSESTGRRPAG